MTLEQDDAQKALEEASKVIEETKQFMVGLPLSVAYDIGTILVTTYPKEDDVARRELVSGIVLRLEQVVPKELVEQGSEDYSGDLNTIVPVPLSQRDIECIGQSANSLPTGRQIIGALPIAPSERAELDGYMNRWLRSFLFLSNEFVKAGGKVNIEIRRTIEEKLS